MKIYLLVLVALLGACGRYKAKMEVHVDRDLRAALAAKVELYRQLVPSVQDADGFVDFDKCDSLLHSGLLGAALRTGNLEAAEASPGRWLRRPTSYEECFATGGSRSTISRDMLLGVVWWAWRHGRLDVLERLRNYGQEHGWVMGGADSTETLYGRAYLTPAFRGMLCRTARALGGAGHGDCYLPQVFSESVTDFEAHLQVLTILLEAEVSGSVSKDALGALRAQVARQPRNPLFHAALGRFDDGTHGNIAATLLLDSPTWPADRLPDPDSACNPWPVMHDFGPDYEACPPDHPNRDRQFSGGDLLFTAYVLGVLE